MSAAESEFLRELHILQIDGLKHNSLRMEYEESVRDLETTRELLEAADMDAEEMAQILHGMRRELGKIYKDAAPPLFREYILYATYRQYGDPLGPDFKTLRMTKSPEEIIESSIRPIRNLDDRLTVDDFTNWYFRVYTAQPHVH